ncbi:hypothetical protein [Dyadobacter psychrotolerans]|uniref:Uncharacterized protein n=1 Tax=Dyadobacter psychrotolerans TaxID=2541721 RepID=A0A4R5DXW5_9BACT|nr:hypothetical protein [Dyadobacter psychrotolerans]TDE16185.1 hypothetical protein E0F88_07990 [Dyadobacter psychrotolerans]
MTFDYPGYPLRFIQKDKCTDESAHLFTHIYKFYSPVTQYFYILRADYHEEDVFSIKFYCKKDRKSDFKYSKIINKGDIGNILLSCANVIPKLLTDYPAASFALVGSRSIDKISGTIEPFSNNQRFRIYAEIIAKKFGAVTFEHVTYPEVSGYLLINRKSGDLPLKESAIKRMFALTYNNLPDII